MSGNWRESAICAETDPDLFSPEKYTGEDVREAKKICLRCPVRRACLADALAEEGNKTVQHRAGIRGGTTPNQRWAMQKKRQQQKEAA